MQTNRIKAAAEARRRKELGLKEDLASRADGVWTVLEAQLAQFHPNEMGLITDYLIERARAYRAEKSLEILKAQEGK